MKEQGVDSRDVVAVVGMAGLFPGAPDRGVFWENLLAGRDCRTPARHEDMEADPDAYLADRKGVPDRYYCKMGGYVRDLPPGLVDDEGLGRVYSWPVHVCREALKDFGPDKTLPVPGRAGLVFGNLSFPLRSTNRLILPLYHQAVERAVRRVLPGFFLPPVSEKAVNPKSARMAGYPIAMAAGALGLAGPVVTLDAACASSLYAVKLACDYLLSGRADLMLAGAVSAADPFFVTMGFSIFQAHPENGVSRPLDASSRGLVAGEGAGAFVLKRFSDAKADGDRVYAVIRGAGLSNDGRGASVLSPNPKGQRLCFERAYAAPRADPGRVGFVECHATGTPLGDKIELDSVADFFGQAGNMPLLGSVKANLGHLLTAAGMAGMMKTILALNHKTLPGTPGLDSPLASRDGKAGGGRIPASPLPWPGDRPLGAVSAFGFGGTNAHLVFEEPDPSLAVEPKAIAASFPKLAIVGMDSRFGPVEGTPAYLRTLFEGKQAFSEVPGGRWLGLSSKDGKRPRAALNPGFDLDFLRFKVPPKEEDRLIPQQLLLMKAADRALSETGVEPGQNVAVIVAMGTEPALHRFRGRVNLEILMEKALAGLPGPVRERVTKAAKDAVSPAASASQYTSFIGNIMACRVSALWDFSGPAFTVSAEENSVFRALEIAAMLLANGEAVAVVVGAVDLAAGPEAVMAAPPGLAFDPSPKTLSFDRQSRGRALGEGAGAVVLRRAEDSASHGERAYAVIDSLAFSPGDGSEAVKKAIREALSLAGKSPDSIQAVEAYAGGGEGDEAEMAGLLMAFPENPPLSLALGSAKAHVGHAGAAQGLASIIKAALMLRHRFLPGVPGWSGVKDPGSWEKGPFYMPEKSRPWFPSPDGVSRAAAVLSLGADGFAGAAVLSDAEESVEAGAEFFAAAPVCLFPLRAPDREGLVRKLEELEAALEKAGDLKALGRNLAENAGDNGLSLCLVAGNRDELRSEIRAAKNGILSQDRDWLSPRGSAFSPRPAGREGKAAFVYPGAFNAYPGMGRGLFSLFPDLYESVVSPKKRLGELFGDSFLFLRSLDAMTREDRDAALERFVHTPISVFESGILFAIAATDVLRKHLKIEPASAIGYSMGEVTMKYALNVWQRSDAMSERLRVSPVFRTSLAGPMETVRRAFGLPLAEDGEPVWATFALKSPAPDVEKACTDQNRVFVTFINTPTETVISGHPTDCREVIGRLGCEAVPVPMSDALHTEIVRAEFGEMADLHTLPVTEVPGIRFYSAVGFAPIGIESRGVAENIAEIYCRSIDFVSLVRAAYKDGVRVFIESGPRENCSRWIDEILADEPHLAVSFDRKGADAETNLARLAARLFAHNLPVDLDFFFGKPVPVLPGKRLIQRVSTGGPGIEESLDAWFAENPMDQGLAQKEPPAAAPPPEPSAPKPPPVARPAPRALETVIPEISTPPPEPLPMASRFYENISAVTEAHKSFLSQRAEAVKILEGLLLQGMEEARQAPGILHEAPRLHLVEPPVKPAPMPEPVPEPPTAPRQSLIFDQADLDEFATGSIARVFGPEYGVIDTYSRRVRLPMDPYLLVSRVTKLDAQRGEFKPSSMTTEYDIPQNAWYGIDGQAPWAVCVESGQCDLLLISYLGIDFECKGDRVYRLLDCTLTFLSELPKEGQTLSYDISIQSYARSGGGLLFFFSYDCFADGELILTMRNGCAGFFTDKELAQGKGIIRTEEEVLARAEISKSSFAPLLECPRRSFMREDLVKIIEGDPAACFGPDYEPRGTNPSLRFAAEKMLMVDRVTRVEPAGGPWGLGLIEAEKDLAPDHWYFPCHFKDDEVLAGSLMAEGCVQLLQFFMVFLGLQTRVSDARFQPIPELPQKVRCRGQVIPGDLRLTYRMEVKKLGLDPEPYAVADVDILLGDRVVVDFKDLGVRMKEKPGAPALALPPEPRQREDLFTRDHLVEFATGSLAKCFGPRFEVYEGRQPPRTPNGDLQLISRVLEAEGIPGDFKQKAHVVTEYDVPENAWFFRQNADPAVMPYSILMEIALQPCGFVSTWAETTLIRPDVDYFFRNLDGTGNLLREVDLRGKTIVNRSELLSTTATRAAILQNFTFELSEGGEPFYKGTAGFGYFIGESLVNQVGLDQGVDNHPRTSGEYLKGEAVVLDLTDKTASSRFFGPGPARPNYRLGGPMLEFLDRVTLVPGGGKYGLGYLLGEKAVDPTDWFYPCHFHNDPVMPGSLGVESMLQALQVFALDQDLGRDFSRPGFAQRLGTTVWKYRGQITPANRRMTIDLHVKTVEPGPAGITVLADGSLWKENIRIYEVTDLGFVIRETP